MSGSHLCQSGCERGAPGTHWHADVPPDLGVQRFGYDDPHPWVMPLLGALAFGAFMLMLITGTAPWQ